MEEWTAINSSSNRTRRVDDKCVKVQWQPERQVHRAGDSGYAQTERPEIPSGVVAVILGEWEQGGRVDWGEVKVGT